MGVFWQLFNFAMVHSVISIVGMLYVETEILRTGNEQLLNDLKEGVIIMDKESSMVMFVNNAAKRFKIRKDKNISMSFVGEGEAFDLKQKMFALIDLNMINEDDNSDSSNMI